MFHASDGASAAAGCPSQNGPARLTEGNEANEEPGPPAFVSFVAFCRQAARRAPGLFPAETSLNAQPVL